MNVQTHHRYFFCVLKIDDESNAPDFTVVGEFRFCFSRRLWDLYGDLAAKQSSVSESFEEGVVEVRPLYEFYCRNGFANPDHGEEVIPSANVPNEIQIGIVPDLPDRLYVSQSIVERATGHGFKGVGYIEVSDNPELIRPTYSFLRKLEGYRRDDNLLDAIARYCESTGRELIRFTLAEPAYKFRGKKYRGMWYLSSNGAGLALSCRDWYYFLDEDETLVAEIPRV